MSTFFPGGMADWMSGYLAAKPIEDGEWLIVIPLTFNRARLCVATPGMAGNPSVEHWCMDSPAQALEAWLHWPEPPTTWNRHQRRDYSFERSPEPRLVEAGLCGVRWDLVEPNHEDVEMDNTHACRLPPHPSAEAHRCACGEELQPPQGGPT